MINNEEEMAKEQWSRVSQLSRKEMADRQVQFEYYQKHTEKRISVTCQSLFVKAF